MVTSITSFGEWTTTDCCFELSVKRDDENAAMILGLRDDVTLTYKDHILKLELGKSGHGRKQRTVKLDSLKNMTVYSDTSAIEIFY